MLFPADEQGLAYPKETGHEHEERHHQEVVRDVFEKDGPEKEQYGQDRHPDGSVGLAAQKRLVAPDPAGQPLAEHSEKLGHPAKDQQQSQCQIGTTRDKEQAAVTDRVADHVEPLVEQLARDRPGAILPGEHPVQCVHRHPQYQKDRRAQQQPPPPFKAQPDVERGGSQQDKPDAEGRRLIGGHPSSAEPPDHFLKISLLQIEHVDTFFFPFFSCCYRALSRRVCSALCTTNSLPIRPSVLECGDKLQEEPLKRSSTLRSKCS